MKKLFCVFLVLFLLVCSACSYHKYNYSNWKTYEFPNEHFFMYPNEWSCSTTENGLLYFYMLSSDKTETIMAFQSHIDPSRDTFDKSLIEKNAYCDEFQGVSYILCETGPVSSTVYGIDVVLANSEKKQLKYIEFDAKTFSKQQLKGGYDYKIYFTENVSENIFQQIYHSFE